MGCERQRPSRAIPLGTGSPEHRDRGRSASGGPDRFALHVGTFEPRKNLAMLLRAWEQLHTSSRVSAAARPVRRGGLEKRRPAADSQQGRARGLADQPWLRVRCRARRCCIDAPCWCAALPSTRGSVYPSSRRCGRERRSWRATSRSIAKSLARRPSCSRRTTRCAGRQRLPRSPRTTIAGANWPRAGEAAQGSSPGGGRPPTLQRRGPRRHAMQTRIVRRSALIVTPTPPLLFSVWRTQEIQPDFDREHIRCEPGTRGHERRFEKMDAMQTTSRVHVVYCNSDRPS